MNPESFYLNPEDNLANEEIWECLLAAFDFYWGKYPDRPNRSGVPLTRVLDARLGTEAYSRVARYQTTRGRGFRMSGIHIDSDLEPYQMVVEERENGSL